MIGEPLSLGSVVGATSRGAADAAELRLLGRKEVWMESKVLNFKEKLRVEQVCA